MTIASYAKWKGRTCIQKSSNTTALLENDEDEHEKYPSCVCWSLLQRSIERLLKKEKVRLRRRQEKKIKNIYRTYTKMIHKIQRKIKYFEEEASMLSSLLYGGEIGTQNGVLPKPKCRDTSDAQKFLEDLACLDEVSALYEDDTFDLDTVSECTASFLVTSNTSHVSKISNPKVISNFL